MYVDEEGILHLKIIKDANITLENIKENYSSFKQLLGNNRVLLLIDSRVKYKFSKEARAYTASKQGNLNRIATAFLINSFSGRLRANFYIWFNSPIVPTRIFTSEEKALNWLKSFYVMPGEPYVTSKKGEH